MTAGTEDQIKRGRISAEQLQLSYGDNVICSDLNLAIKPHSLTVIVGPNACGKSTLLRALARLLKPTAGAVLLDGLKIGSLSTRAVARMIGLLPQTNLVPEAITVRELVACGRYPHQRPLRRWSSDDEQAVQWALAAANVEGLSARLVDELSGGQRQRVWIAMVLAQQTDVILLDEPTTFLDLGHQLELLELLSDLRQAQQRTLVLVLHDIGQAARYATDLIVMRAGRILATGDPQQILTPELIEQAFGVSCVIIDDPVTGTPLIVPTTKGRVARQSRPDGP